MFSQFLIPLDGHGLTRCVSLVVVNVTWEDHLSGIYLRGKNPVASSRQSQMARDLDQHSSDDKMPFMNISLVIQVQQRIRAK